MKEKFVTVVGMAHYVGLNPFSVGDVLRCKKEPDNVYDEEAIQVMLPIIGKVGYIANSTHTVAKGTMSAGRIYDMVKKRFYIRILFIAGKQIVCRIEEGADGKDMEKEINKQIGKKSNDEFWD